MAMIYPRNALLSSISSSFISKQEEVYTIWMKSLVLNGKGCTVFDSNGQIVYRVDNYNRKDSNEVYLMDSRGKVLFTIYRKKFNMFGCWEGYRSTGTNGHNEKEKLGFQVKRSFNISKWKSRCEVIMGLDENVQYCYDIQSWTTSSCKIVDKFGAPIAEVKSKQSTRGEDLGNDVLTMMVKPLIDHSLIMGLIVGHSLLNCKM